MKKIFKNTLTLVLVLSILTMAFASGTKEEPKGEVGKEQTTAKGEEKGGEAEAKSDAEGKVYYLNFKPEVDAIWQEVAEAYTAETGVPVKVVTAASGTYETTLKAEISKSDAPTIFQINGPVGYESWKDYTLDLSASEIYNHLLNKDMAVSTDEGVFGVPYVVEGYGIIYNDAIMQKYFAMDGAKAKNVEEINTFTKLKEVADDMQAKKAELGIDGVFASTSLAQGEDWRWQTHLANLPVYYEYKAANVKNLDAVEFTYGENFKNIFDLFITDSVVEPGLLTSKSVTDSMAEFALGKCAMVQNGNWAWGQISGVDGNTVKEEDIKFMPIYTGVEGEEKQGICVGTENFLSINSQVSEADQQASLDFLNWVYTSETGKKFVVEKLGFITPFDSFTEAELPTDPLAKEVIRYMGNGTYNVDWNFTSFPSQNFKDMFGQALGQYAAGNVSWDEVKQVFIDEWANEKSMTK